MAEALDKILVSEHMVDTFVSHVSFETKTEGMETLGFALGQKVNYNNNDEHEYHEVNVIYIPHQKVTKNSCEPTWEAGQPMVDYIRNEKLILLGMIHTHPTQGNFPSAPDCHSLQDLDQSLPNVFSCIYAGMYTFY